MNVAGTIAVTPGLSESQRTALVSLLADEDPAVYQTIREMILSQGVSAASWLRPHTLSRDPTLRRRAQDIVLQLDRQLADNRFLAFCLQHGEEFDLEAGAWLFAQTKHPGINVEAYQALIDSFASDLRERLDLRGDARNVLNGINQYLFHDLHFVGNEAEYYDPENSYLNRVLDRRKGNPINLCLLYLLVARRLKLPMTGIGMPGHFVCRYQSSSVEIYVDAFNRGKLLTKADCIQFLLKGNYGLRDAYLGPASPRKMLLRICNNLLPIYQQLEQADDATRLQRYLVALDR